MFTFARFIILAAVAAKLVIAAPTNDIVSVLTKRVVYSCSDDTQDAFATAS